MVKEKMILLGCGGHAKSVIDAVEASGSYEIAGFVDKTDEAEVEYRGYRIIGDDDDLERIYESGIQNAFVCVGFVGNGTIRNKLYKALKEIGFSLPCIIDPTAALAADVRVGEGTFVGKKAVVNTGAILGKMVIINTAAVIEHDCFVGDFCHIAVSAVVCGASQIGENVLIGANATVLQGLNIGEDSVVGAGAVVLQNLPAKCMAAGVPARIRRNN